MPDDDIDGSSIPDDALRDFLREGLPGQLAAIYGDKAYAALISQNQAVATGALGLASRHNAAASLYRIAALALFFAAIPANIALWRWAL